MIVVQLNTGKSPLPPHKKKLIRLCIRKRTHKQKTVFKLKYEI